MTLYNHFKSKDELVVAALRRRDEIFRNKMMKFVESATDDAEGRVLAVFDFLGAWFKEKDFCGCMFINSSGELTDTKSEARRVVAEHLRDVQGYIERLCAAAGVREAGALAEELALLTNGAIVTANAYGRVYCERDEMGRAAEVARGVAEKLLGSAARG